MKISLAHHSASKLITVRAATGKSISTLMEEAMQLLQEKYQQEVLTERMKQLGNQEKDSSNV